MSVSTKSKSPDAAYFWGGLSVALLGTSLSIAGLPEITVPLVALALSLVTGIFGLVAARHFAWNKRHRLAFYSLPIAIVFLCAWLEWHVFKVDMNIRLASGSQANQTDEQYLFAVELSNRGKGTSLRDWQATLTLPDGKSIPGLPLALVGKSVKMGSEEGLETAYALPQCDLRIETARAVQPGDSVYGIVGFQFAGALASKGDPENVIELSAKDMLGRTIHSKPISFADIHRHARTVFPCPVSSEESTKPAP